MAGSLKIPSGTKMKLSYDAPIGESPKFDLICSFIRALDESAFLISVPMKNGAPLPFDFSKKILMRYAEGSEERIVAGYADEEVKEGIRTFWRIRRVQEQRTFFERRDVRYKVALHVEYLQDHWRPNEDGIIETEEGMTLDISAGGIAMYVNRVFDVGESVFIRFPHVGLADDSAAGERVGVVCWMREAPKGSPYRHFCGLNFKFSGDADKQSFGEYVESIKERYHL